MKNSLTNCVLFFNFIGGCALKRALTVTKIQKVFVINKKKERVKKTLRKLFQNQKLLSLWLFLWPLSCPCPLDISAESEAGREAGEEHFMLASRVAQCCTGNHVSVRLARFIAGLIGREKCHTAEINKRGRANFDSYAKVIWIRQTFDVYKAGLDIPVGAGFLIICSFNIFFLL